LLHHLQRPLGATLVACFQQGFLLDLVVQLLLQGGTVALVVPCKPLTMKDLQ
jgi:hypothetical protein